MSQIQHHSGDPHPRTWLRRHQAAVFLFGSVALGWLATVIVAGLPSGTTLLPLLAIPVSFVPAVLALVILRIVGTAQERAAHRARMTRLRTGWRSYAVASFGLPLIYFAGVGLATLFGASFPFHPALLVLLPIFLVTNFGEEIGWRGYAVPVLQKTRSPLATGLIIGLAWGAFHWVALLGNVDAPFAYVAVGTVLLLAFSVILTALFDSSGESVPLVALAHATYDTVAVGVSPLAETGVALLAFALTAVSACVVAVVLVAITGTSLRPGHHLVLSADAPASP